MEALRDYLSASPTPWRTIDSLETRGRLLDPEIQNAIAGAIERSPEPWWLVGTIATRTQLMTARPVIAALDSAKSKITEAIRSGNVNVIFEVADADIVIEDSDFQSAVARAIRTYTNPSWLIAEMGHIHGLVTSRIIQEAVADVLMESAQPWNEQTAICDISELRNSHLVKYAIREVSPAIARVIREESAPWWIIGGIGRCGDLLEPEIIDAIESRANDIAEAIRTGAIEKTLVEELLAVETLRNNPDVERAMRERGIV